MRKFGRILFLILILTMSYGMTAFAEESDGYTVETIGMEAVSYVNPLYEDLVIEPAESSGISFYADPDQEYMESLEDVYAFLRDAMEARVTNVTVYYKSTEWIMEDSGWVSAWLKQIYKETQFATEGDYLKLHVHKVRFCGGSASRINGVYYYPLPFEFTYLSTSDQEELVTEKVDGLLETFEFTEETSDIIKIRTIYDWICGNVTYDYGHDESYTLKHTAYAAIVDGQSVCQGYASLLYRLFREAGLSTRAITGKSNGVGHAWNIVKFGDYYYNLDSTWDAGLDTYRYYMKCDENFKNHMRGEDYTTNDFYAAYPMSERDFEGYKVTYDPNGGNMVTSEQIKNPGEDLILTAEVPVREWTLRFVSNSGESVEQRMIGAEFLCWNTDVDGEGKTYLSEDIYNIDEDLHLYAQWKDSCIGELPELTRTDYIFKGWYTENNGGKQVFSDDVMTSDLQIYAFWERIGGPADVNALTVQPIRDDFYTGDPLEPELHIFEENYELIKDVDYTVSYKNNINAGTAEVIIRGQGDYCGETTKIFKIKKAKQQLSVYIESNRIETGTKEKISVEGLGTVTFTSSDASIAKVDAEGYITGIKAGKVDVTVEAAGDENHQKATNVLAIEIKHTVHVYDSGTVLKKPTYQTDGVCRYTCKICGGTKTGKIDKLKAEVYEDDVEAFVARLYVECLNREPEETGLEDWTERLKSKELAGIAAASGIVFSQEFKNRNLCNEDYVELLYRAFMGRSSDPGGKNYWMGRLSTGATREEVFNGFALSVEFGNICKSYNIVQGQGIDLPKYGTVPMGSCSMCDKEDGVTAFVKRMYEICLGRDAETAGLRDWTGRLWNHTASGKDVGYGFIFSMEYIQKQTTDDEYVECLYNAFMGRASDFAGKMDWLERLKNDVTRQEVFEGFVYSNEFTNICHQYGILRD